MWGLFIFFTFFGNQYWFEDWIFEVRVIGVNVWRGG